MVDVSKDVINNSASRITEQYINHQLQNLNTEWFETSDVRKSTELSKQINIKTNELINSKNYFDKMDSSLKAIMYGANIANAFAKNYAYNYDTATLLDDAIDKDLLSNINTENWYWLDEANRINSSIKSNWSNIGNSVLDSTVKLFEDEGNDLLICSIAENASSYLLIVKAELMVGKLIFKDNYEKVDKDILSGFESDLQAQYKQLCNTLYLKAQNELYASEKTIDQMLAAYKFYYKLSAVYLKNVSIQFEPIQFEQNNWMEDYADDAAEMYYRLLTCFKTPNSGFEKLEDDVFSAEVFEKEILNPANIEFVSADVSEYPLVKLYLRVTDPDTGASVENILMNSFNVVERFEGGEYLSREVKNAFPLEGNDGLKTALVADKSNSISDYDMDKIQSVMIEFVNSMDFDAGDEAMVIAFDSIVQTMCTFTKDQERLTHGIENMSTDGRTACYDAIYNAVQNASLRGGARCVIAFTDGIDNESIHTPEEVIRYANTMQVPLYIIGVGDLFDTYDLKNMANSTNGRYWYIDDLYGLEEIFNQIYMEQQDLYVVEYESDTSVEANAVRDVIIEIDGSGYTADLSTSFTPIISANSTHTSRYEIFADDVTWEEANALCIQKGGHLATITDAAEEQELIKMAEANGLSYVWLGGYTSYDSYNDVFAHWITGEEFSYQNWAAGEPSRQDRDGIPEWYLMLWNIKSLGGWTWNDQRNDPMSEVDYMSGKIGYICEYE